MKALITGLRSIYKSLPTGMQKPLVPIGAAFLHALDKESRQRKAWFEQYYGRNTLFWREQLFVSLARFMHINRPYSGYYMEFGCHSGTTMRLAWKHFRWLIDLQYVAFDSFEGLPQIGALDRMAIWSPGRLKTAEQDFIDIVTASGLPKERLRTVKGYYEKSLTPELAESLLPKTAAVIYVDCDL